MGKGIHHASTSETEGGMVIVILDEVDFRAKNIYCQR